MKQLKSQENCLINPEPSASADLPSVQQRQWKNFWRFHLHHKIFLNRQHRPKDQPTVKAMIRRYYGKKILYVTNLQEANAIVSRSKLLKFVEIQKNAIKKNLKSKGNLVILANNFPSRSKKHQDDELKEDHHLFLKKILKHCPKAKIMIENENHVELPKYLQTSKHLYIRLVSFLGLTVLGEIVRNLLSLETIRIETIPEQMYRTKKKPKKRFFTLLHKLSRLNRVKLATDSSIIFSAELEQDLEEFYSRPINFSLSLKINRKLRFGSPNLARILNVAEYLSLSDFKDQKPPRNEDDMSMVPKEEKKRLKLGMKNIVSILDEGEGFNLEEILSNCGSLENLYIREAKGKARWKKNSKSDQIKGFQNLKVAVLEFSEITHDVYMNPTSSPPLMFCSEIKEKCHSLKHLSLYFNISFHKGEIMPPHELSALRESLNPYVQETSTFDKLKRLKLVMTPNSLSLFPLSEILSNKSLESFELKFRNQKSKNTEWDPSFARINTSEIRKLTLTIPEGRKIPLCGIAFLNYVRRLDHLQVVELIDKNFGVITFDFLYGLLTSLLDKKGMKRIIIWTKVMNHFSSKKFENLLSNNLEARLKDMFDEAIRDWESRIKELKCLEEVIVGRLHGYSFDYLLYHSKMGIVDKFVWTGKELYSLLYGGRDWGKNSQEVYDLLGASREHSDWPYSDLY